MIYMMTNDHSKHILPLSAHLFNKFWPSKDNVTVLCFSEPARLPSNFKTISLGKQSDFSYRANGGTYYKWSDSLIPFFRKVKSKTFILIWDEHIVVAPVDADLLNEIWAYVSSGSASKAILDRHLNRGKFSRGVSVFSEEVVKLDQKTMYRTTLMPSIWKKDYFMRYLRPGLTAWDFEVKNIYRSLRDGATIIAPRNKDIATTYNVYIKGKFARAAFDKIDLTEEDRNIANKYIKKRGSIYV